MHTIALTDDERRLIAEFQENAARLGSVWPLPHRAEAKRIIVALSKRIAELERELAARTPEASYWRPCCNARRPLLEPCEHIRIEPEALAKLRELLGPGHIGPDGVITGRPLAPAV